MRLSLKSSRSLERAGSQPHAQAQVPAQARPPQLLVYPPATQWQHKEEGLLLRRVKVSMARRGQLEQREGVLVEPQQPQKQAKRWMLGV